MLNGVKHLKAARFLPAAAVKKDIVEDSIFGGRALRRGVILNPARSGGESEYLRETEILRSAQDDIRIVRLPRQCGEESPVDLP
jgi:hypothetical protein